MDDYYTHTHTYTHNVMICRLAADLAVDLARVRERPLSSTPTPVEVVVRPQSVTWPTPALHLSHTTTAPEEELVGEELTT